jgi:hypothetical protein
MRRRRGGHDGPGPSPIAGGRGPAVVDVRGTAAVDPADYETMHCSTNIALSQSIRSIAYGAVRP